jgi:hypothetical protein
MVTSMRRVALSMALRRVSLGLVRAPGGFISTVQARERMSGNYPEKSEELLQVAGRGFVALLNLKITRGRAPYRDCDAFE